MIRNALCLPLFVTLAAIAVDPGLGRSAEAPATEPAGSSTAPAATQPVVIETLGSGLIQFKVPAGWSKSDKTATPTQVGYASADRQGALAIELLPADATVGPNMAVAVVKKLRADLKAAGSSVVLQPKIEKDPRFDVVIHERWKDGERVADQLHIYRRVGSRIVMMTVKSLAEKPEQAEAIHNVGREMLASARAGRAKK